MEELQQIFEEIEKIYQALKEQDDALSRFDVRNIREKAYQLRGFARAYQSRCLGCKEK